MVRHQIRVKFYFLQVSSSYNLSKGIYYYCWTGRDRTETMVKRKGTELKSSVKKVKKAPKEQVKSGLDAADIERLSQEIIQSLKVNNIVDLLNEFDNIKSLLTKEYNEKVEQIGRELAVNLFKVFQHLIKQGNLKISSSQDVKKQTVNKWLIAKYSSFKNIVFSFLNNKLAQETSLQLDLLSIILNLIKLESKYLKSSDRDLYFPASTYNDLVVALLTSKVGEILSDGSNTNFIILEFLEKFQTHWDLQFYFINTIVEQMIDWKSSKESAELQLIFSNFFTIIKQNLSFTNDQQELKEVATWISGDLPSICYKPSHFKSQYQKVIIATLSYPLLNAQYKSTLLVLHKRIMPFMQQPQALLDFLTDCYDIEDDIIPLLALNSLYELMKNYNLEYPDFYTKLYSLLSSSLMYSRYRSRFFRLLDLFLSSTHLSGNLVASFIKKLARLSISSNSPSVVIVIPFVYNLLKRHPTCMIMLHNSQEFDTYTDPFELSQQDPMKTNAMQSSLWELETLMTHYHPNIATLAKIFGEPFRKHSYNMEDFLDWSYQTLLDSEKTRKYKGMAALEFENFDKLFGNTDDNHSVYANGWTL